jgi:hypothetical protein
MQPKKLQTVGAVHVPQSATPPHPLSPVPHFMARSAHVIGLHASTTTELSPSVESCPASGPTFPESVPAHPVARQDATRSTRRGRILAADVTTTTTPRTPSRTNPPKGLHRSWRRTGRRLPETANVDLRATRSPDQFGPKRHDVAPYTSAGRMAEARPYSAHRLPALGEVGRHHMSPPGPHWPAAPPPPQTSGAGHVPQLRRPPQPSPAGPQLRPWSLQVDGQHPAVVH